MGQGCGYACTYTAVQQAAARNPHASLYRRTPDDARCVSRAQRLTRDACALGPRYQGRTSVARLAVVVQQRAGRLGRRAPSACTRLGAHAGLVAYTMDLARLTPRRPFAVDGVRLGAAHARCIAPMFLIEGRTTCIQFFDEVFTALLLELVALDTCLDLAGVRLTRVSGVDSHGGRGRAPGFPSTCRPPPDSVVEGHGPRAPPNSAARGPGGASHA